MTQVLNLHKSLANLTAARKVRLNATKCTLLHTLRMHFNDSQICEAPLEAADIRALTIADIRVLKDKYFEAETTLDEVSGLTPVVVAKLEPLKWSSFKTSMLEYFSRVIGKHGIPLSYISHPDANGDFEVIYETHIEKMIACTTLRGSKYKFDKGTVFSLLIQHTNITEGYSLVQQYERSRDGCSTWISLLNHFEGSISQERVRQEVATMLLNASYSGPRRNFSFSSYYDRHSYAHNKLLQVRKPMTDEQ